MKIYPLRLQIFVKFIVILFICLNISTGKIKSEQKDTIFSSKNTFYIDFCTKGAFYSINYDRIFYGKNRIYLTYRFGFSILTDAIAFPVGINLFTGKKNSHLEYSLTVVPYIDHYKSLGSDNDLSDKYLYVIPGLGYRFQKPKGGFFIKAVISPTIFLDPPSDDFWNMDPKLYFTANMGIGLTF